MGALAGWFLSPHAPGLERRGSFRDPKGKSSGWGQASRVGGESEQGASHLPNASRKCCNSFRSEWVPRELGKCHGGGS